MMMNKVIHHGILSIGDVKDKECWKDEKKSNVNFHCSKFLMTKLWELDDNSKQCEKLFLVRHLVVEGFPPCVVAFEPFGKPCEDGVLPLLALLVVEDVVVLSIH